VGVYTTADAVRAYVQDNRAAVRALRGADDDALERLIATAQHAVDLVCGGEAPDPSTGLRIDPAALTEAQATALARATAAWVEWALMIGLPVVAGDSIETPMNVAIATPAARQPPKMIFELAGYGLLRRSGTVQPDPEPVLPPWHPWGAIEERAPSEA
jgi:hypothetical protein